MGGIIAKRPQHDFHPSPASEGGPSEREGAISGAQAAAVQSRGCHLVGMCMRWTSLAWPDSRSQESHSTIYGLATRDLVWILVQLILECISCMTPPNFMESFCRELLLHASWTISETVNTKSLDNSHLNPPVYSQV